MRISHKIISQSLYVQGRRALLRLGQFRCRHVGGAHNVSEISCDLRKSTMLPYLPRIRGYGARLKNESALAGHGAEVVRDAIAGKITILQSQLRRSLTWDSGAEMSKHAQLRNDPHSSWQRGTNENTNGLLRQCFPKNTDLNAHGADNLAAVAAAFNTRQRKTRGWRTSAETFDQVLQPVHADVATAD